MVIAQVKRKKLQISNKILNNLLFVNINESSMQESNMQQFFGCLFLFSRVVCHYLYLAFFLVSLLYTI